MFYGHLALLSLGACAPPTSSPDSAGFDEAGEAPWQTANTDSAGGDSAGGGDSERGDSERGDSASDEADSHGDPSALVFEGERPRNVLMISVDTFRPDRMGRASGEGDTPFLNELLEGAFVFDAHRSCSNWTFASVTCVQSTQRPSQSRFLPWVSLLQPVPDRVTLASEILADAGYQTHLVSGNDYFSDAVGLGQGFDSYSVFGGSGDRLLSQSEALFAEIDPERPWYVHSHLMDPHASYNPPAEYLTDLDALPPIDYDLSGSQGYQEVSAAWPFLSEAERALIKSHIEVRYLGELNYTSDHISGFLKRLEEGGWLKDTLIVFWSDHGEQLWERGDLGHGRALFLEETDSIAAFVADGLQPTSWQEPTSHEDIWPTIFDAIGLDVTGYTLGGWPVGQRGEAPVFGLNFSGHATLHVIESDGLRLHYAWSGEKMLFRPLDDPGEREDLYAQGDAALEALWAHLLPEVEAIESLQDTSTPTDAGL
jgi:hypothetical protein